MNALVLCLTLLLLAPTTFADDASDTQLAELQKQRTELLNEGKALVDEGLNSILPALVELNTRIADIELTKAKANIDAQATQAREAANRQAAEVAKSLEENMNRLKNALDAATKELKK